MVSQNAVFSLIYNAATCFIPREELTEEQREKLDNITYKSCYCPLCSGKTGKKVLGHANRQMSRINWSNDFFKPLIKQDLMMPETLFLLLDTALHEIIHIIYPEFDEYETKKKTAEWLKRNLWLEVHKQATHFTKQELKEIGYILKKPNYKATTKQNRS